MANLLNHCRIEWEKKHREVDTTTDSLRFRFDHLIIRENVLTFIELLDLPYLAKKLEFLKEQIAAKARLQGGMSTLLCFECTKPISGMTAKD